MARVAPWCGGGAEQGRAAASSWRAAARGRNGAWERFAPKIGERLFLVGERGEVFSNCQIYLGIGNGFDSLQEHLHLLK